ncbi:MAG: ABC transporter permease [Christensenellales bacterium]|jgi:ribose/xylose/arabinose/galactoside ABC-type transport system permease subunit
MARRRVNMQIISALIGLIALCVVLTIMTPNFIRPDNIVNVLSQATVNGIVALGMTFVIITGGIDLSVGSIVAISGVIMGMLLKTPLPFIVPILVGLAVGVLCGLINGLLITFGKLPPFIATLGMMSVARGIALIITNGMPVSTFSEGFRWIGVGAIPLSDSFGIPVQVVFMVILYLLAYYILRWRQVGRYIYSLGGNEEVARLSGINVRRYKTIAYMISGLTAAIAMVVLTAKLNSAQPIAGYSYELDAVAASVIGGTSLNGGVGSVWGTLIGAIIMSVLRNGLNLLNASSYLTQVVIGLVIICAVLIDTLRKK